MEEEIIENACIKSTMLGIEDHDVMSFYLYLDYGGRGQGAGGYCLDSYSREMDKRIGWAGGIAMIRAILEVVGVRKWEDLPGKNIRVKHTDSNVSAVGNILRDKWCNFGALAKEYK